MRYAARVAWPLVFILLAAVVFAPVPGHTVWLGRLHDFAHGPVFGGIAVLLLLALRRLPRGAALTAFGQYAIAFAGAVALALLTELAQIPAGGDASWDDAHHDAIGAAAFLLAFAAFDSRGPMRTEGYGMRIGSLLAALTLFGYLAVPVVRSMIAYHERRSAFPVIADFSQRLDFDFTRPSRVVMQPAPLPEALSTGPGESAARVRFLPEQYAGVHFYEPWPNWLGYSALAIEFANPLDRELALVVRVHDAHHNNEYTDRYNRELRLPAHTREVFRFPLEEIRQAPRGRSMDMEHIRGVVVFRADASSDDEMYLVRMWLE